ncbi:hypothetical protein ACFL67_02575 [candidate division KSB1 bacterium]
MDNSKVNQGNPFEYNIENFKKTDVELLHYSEINQISLDVQQLTSIAVGSDDRIFAAGDNSIFEINRDSNFQSIISTAGNIYCLAVDESGDLYLGMSRHIEVYDQNGAKKAQWESIGKDAIITSIAASEEFVFVADAGSQIVWKYDKDGNILMRIGDENADKDIPGFIIPSPFFDVSIDPDGFLWVANTGRHSMENYTFDGDLRSSWGEYSMEIEGFCGCCNPTHIAILDDGKFITSEKGIARVKIYNRLGELESVVAGADQFEDYTEGLDLARDSTGRIYVVDPAIRSIRVFEKN